MTGGASLPGDAVLVRGGDLLTAEVDGELMAMSVERGTCYGLNAVGARVWALLAEPRSFDSLCEQLQAEFEVDEDQCRAEVGALLDDLRTEGMVTVRTG